MLLNFLLLTIGGTVIVVVTVLLIAIASFRVAELPSFEDGNEHAGWWRGGGRIEWWKIGGVRDSGHFG